MAGLTKKTSAFDDENLSGRSQKLFFEVTEEENYTYYGNHEVDFNKRTSIDCEGINACLLYTSPSPRDGLLSRMPSSA